MTTAIARRSSASSFTRQLALVFGGSLFLAACAQVSVPMWPVPMTMQTFAVLVIGAALGSRLGAAAVALYLIEGAVGLPVFAGFRGGAVVFAGPTAGYLLAFVPAAWLIGVASERGLLKRVGTALVPMLVGTALILMAGAAWLAVFFGESAWAVGVAPFVVGGVLKSVLAAMAAPKSVAVVRKFGV